MSNIETWQNTVFSVAGATIGQFLAYLPQIVGAVLVLVLGIVLGNWAKTALVKSLELLKFDNLAKDSKLNSFLRKAEVAAKVEEVLGGLLKWIIVLVFFIAATNILGLTTVADLLGGILRYIPNVLSAVIVLALGILLAGFVESLVKGALASVDLRTSRLMGKIASYTVVTIATLAAFSELKIAESFINTLFIGFVAMLSLGMGLALGLGAKDTVAEMLQDWYKDLKKDLKKK